MARPRLPAEFESEQPAPQTPGDRLRAAREGQGLSVQDVAARLRLDTKIIANLEANAFDRFPASAYVRGYLRAYARLMNMDPASLMAAFDRQAGDPPDLAPSFASSPEPQARAADFPVRLVTYLVIFGLLALLGTWLWQTQTLSNLATLSLPGWDGGEPGSDGADIAGGGGDPGPRGPAQASALDYTYPVVTHDGTAGVAPPDRLIPATGGTSPAAIPAPAAPEQPAPVPAATPATAEPVAPADAVDTDVEATEGNRVVMLNLSGDSWVEIHDADDRKLYYDLGRKGSRIAVQGTPPYRIRLGKAAVVKVTFAGQNINLTPFTNDGVARFQIATDGLVSE
jgi:cytoskeleton protein RodZ